jgi:hypothetical protein
VSANAGWVSGGTDGQVHGRLRRSDYVSNLALDRGAYVRGGGERPEQRGEPVCATPQRAAGICIILGALLPDSQLKEATRTINLIMLARGLKMLILPIYCAAQEARTA